MKRNSFSGNISLGHRFLGTYISHFSFVKLSGFADTSHDLIICAFYNSLWLSDPVLSTGYRCFDNLIFRFPAAAFLASDSSIIGVTLSLRCQIIKQHIALA